MQGLQTAGGASAASAAQIQGYRSESNAIDQGQFSVLFQNLRELQNTLEEAASRLGTKTNVLLGQVPQPASPPPGQPAAEPNGVVQSMIWGVRDMIRIVGAMHDDLNRIEQSGLGQ